MRKVAAVGFAVMVFMATATTVVAVADMLTDATQLLSDVSFGEAFVIMMASICFAGVLHIRWLISNTPNF